MVLRSCSISPRFISRSATVLFALAFASLCLLVVGASAEEADETAPEDADSSSIDSESIDSESGDSKGIGKGSKVAVEYTLTLEDGTEIENNVGKEALTFEQGTGQIIPGLDKEVAGMKVGDAKKVTVNPEEGYGPLNPEAYQQVPVSDLPEDARVVGTSLMTKDDQGRMFPLRVDKIEGDVATLDFNHPLAGQTLIFDFKIVEIE